MADRVGQQLGNYRLIRLLGRGGFAEVYLGQHIRLSSYAAIKVLSTQLAGSDADSFQREAHTIARLLHPHIIRVFDFDIAEGTPFLIMDYAPNGTLCNPHPKGTRVPIANIVSYARQVADALQYAHNEKVIHRDIKPENMLLGRNNEVLLSDFGIATMTQTTRDSHTRDIVGTVSYMAPEQIQGKPHPASDQYSLGIVIYEWLTGERPFQGSFTEIAIQQVMAPPKPLHEKIPGIPPHLEQVIMIALAKEPHQRFASIQSFANALEQASASGPTFHPVSAPVSPSPQVFWSSPVPVVEEVVNTGPTIPAFAGSSGPVHTPVPQTPVPQLSSTPPPVSPSFPVTTPVPAGKKRTFSRRTIVAGLAGLLVVGGGAIGLALTRNSGIAGPSVTPTGVATTGTSVTPFSGLWSLLPPLPFPDADNVAIHVRLQQRDYIYVTGGNRGRAYSPTYDTRLYRYDIAAAQWETVSTTFPVMFNSAVVQDEQKNLYFTGGYSPVTQMVTTLLYKYQPATGTLQSIAVPAQIVFGYGGSMVTDGQGHLYLMQGYMDVFNSHTSAGTGWYRYDIAQNQWQTLAPLPQGVGYAVLARDSHGDIVLLGGVTDTEQTNGTTNIYRYSIASNTWTQGQTAAPQAFNGASSCDLGNGKVIVLGGWDPVQKVVLENAWLIDLDTLAAKPLTTIPEGSRLGAAAYDGVGKVYLVRGSRNGADVPTSDFLSL